MPRKKPKVDRARQRQATTKLVDRKPGSGLVRTGKYVTLKDVNDYRRMRSAPTMRTGVRLGIASRARAEYGASGTQNVYGMIHGEDYNSLFDGKNGLTIYDQMYRSDAQLGAATDIIMQPIRAARWKAEYPENPSAREKDITDLLNRFLFESGEWPDGESWDFYLRHLLLRVPFGFGFVEPVWMYDEDEGLLRWKRLAPRLPRTVDKFLPWPDGSLKAIVQYVAEPGTAHFEEREIPSDYSLISVRERLGDNYFGQSIYRRLYKHWFYKDDAYRIDGVRLDRYGVGVPVAKLGEGYVLEGDELDEIELSLIALRSHERAYLIEPENVTFRIMTPDGGKGGADGLMDSVKHHNEQIVQGVLATFLGDHSEGLNTNRTRTLADIFLHALRAEANGIAGDVRSQLVRRWVLSNFDITDGTRIPPVTVSGIGDMTPEQYSAVLAPLVAAGLITAEDDLENALRKMIGLGPLPDGWKRGAAKPAPPAIAKPAPGNNGGNNGGGARPDPNQQNKDGAPEPDPTADPKELASSLRLLAQAIEDREPPVINMPPITINLPPDETELEVERDAQGRIVRATKGRRK
jgi:hypothetical protein